MSSKVKQPFSEELGTWLQGGHDKTLGSLANVFKEKAFALIFLLLMALPALPLPTGGLTHIFELIVGLVCLEMIIGRRTIWLPARWLKLDTGKFMREKSASKLISIIKWFEKFSRRRWSGLLQRKSTGMLTGLVVLTFTIAAFVAPPFSGLDTLPALGVVIISLSLILEDVLLSILGIIVGSLGIGLEIAAGTALYSGLTHFF
jgi:hypothetical protein